MKTIFKLPGKPTHIARVSGRYAAVMAQVCELIEWGDEQYCDHCFEQYENFFMHCRGRIADALLQKARLSPVFRGFWVNEWATRNTKEFLPYCWDTGYDLYEYTEEYLAIHNAARICADGDFFTRFKAVLKLI